MATLGWMLVFATTSMAGKADVVRVRVEQEEGRTWTFAVTVRHDDQGWDHYADRWEVLGPKGEVLGTRVLLHPHVGEQPFTRSLSGVKIPENVRKVQVRARDSVHGYGGKEILLELPGK